MAQDAGAENAVADAASKSSRLFVETLFNI